MFAREGGEGQDILMDDVDTDGSTISGLALHENERELLELVRKNFDKVIVLLNSPYQMEVQDIIPYADSILFIGYPGHQGFTGVAEILKGTVNPSGHLTDTYATDSLSSPAAVNSGTRTPQFANVAEINATIGEDENAEYMSFQAEGIYIGYRYYETRYADAVMGQGNATAPVGALEGASSWNYADEVQYPFGYGLSYTTFDQKLDSVDVGEDEITAKVTVTNTGDMAGKSVVQLYAQTPYGDYERQHGVEKSAIQLAGFGKTQELAPGASETVTITVDKYLLASYDTTAHDGAGGYILSDGDYYLAIGEDSHDALNNVLAAEGYTAANGMTAEGTAAKTYSFKQSFDDDKYRTGENGAIVSNQFADADLNYWVDGAGTYLSRSDWEATYPVEQTTVEATPEMMNILAGEWYEKPEGAPSYSEVAANFGVDSGLNLAMMKDVPLSDHETWLKFIYQLQPEDLPNATAESFQSPAVGDLSPAFAVGDGCDSVGGTYPLTVEFNGEQVNPVTTRYCSNVILAGTFNADLYAGRGTMMGEDGMWSGYMINYNLGNDLHRTPFGGRNFEYISEDPYLTGWISAVQILGMEKSDVTGTIKHFCANNQESNRHHVDAVVSERALREIYLKGYEIAVKEGGARSIMSTYGPVNGIWTAGNYDLLTTILRGEWNYDGFVMTDWWAMSNREGYEATKTTHAPMVSAGNDVFMVCTDCSDMGQDDVKEALENGEITRGDLQRNAMNVLHFILGTPSILRFLDRISEEEKEAQEQMGDNDFVAADLVTYEADPATGDVVIDASAWNTKKGNSEVCGVTILADKMGTYDIEIEMKSDLEDLAQLPVTVYIDNIVKTMISIRGTKGEWIKETRDLGFFFGPNHYLKLYFGANGLELGKIRLKLREGMEVLSKHEE